MKVLIDNGHGSDTPGKCSPDRRLLEYRYAREIASETVRRLRAEGVDADLLVPETTDISLSERARRANKVCDAIGTANVCLVSIHVNAAGSDGKWHEASGWEAWTSRGQTLGDALADALYDAAGRVLSPIFPSRKLSTLIRTDLSDGDRDKEAGFAILKSTRCAACLTENFFQDCRRDVDWLLSPAGREAIVRLHVEGILSYLRAQARK